MTLTLSPKLEALVQERLSDGRYADADEVLERALRVLAHNDKLERLQALIAEGEAQYARGEYVVYTSELMDDIEREAEERFLRGELPDPDVCP